MPQGWFSTKHGRNGSGAFPRVGHAPASGWSGTYADLILTIGSEGEERTVDEGATYTYSTVAGVGWIRKEAYDLKTGDIALIGKIDGAVVPASETPAWDDVSQTWGNGTITSDGVWVEWEGSASGGSGSVLTNILTEDKWLWRGYVNLARQDDAVYSCLLYFRVPVPGFYQTVRLHFYYQGESRMALRGSTGGPVGEYVVTDIRGRVVFIEVLLDMSDYVQVFVNNQATWTLRHNKFSNQPGIPSYDHVIDCDADATIYKKDVGLIRLT